MSILVTGGAGYIGSHMVQLLGQRGHRVVVVDNLQSGHREAVPEDVPFLQADVADGEKIASFVAEHGVTAVFHFASRIQVGESVLEPKKYYQGNLGAAISLLDTLLSAGIRRFVLSSTAAVYGNPVRVPLDEDHPTQPINPYGETKLAIEHMLEHYARAYGLRWVALRYFNAAGAARQGNLCERHEPETHLIPLIFRAIETGKPITVFGRDYPTPDGTCVRDYIHVLDLAEAHLAALRYLDEGGQPGAFNLGTGTGYSVAEVIEACRKISGREVPVADGPRREGDPPELVAGVSRAREILGFRPSRSRLETIIADAWNSLNSMEKQ